MKFVVYIKLRKYLPSIALLLLVSVRLCIDMLVTGELFKQSTLTIPFAKKIAEDVTLRTREVLPAVHADLLLGMTIGVDTIKGDTKFYQDLITTGLVHVVVVSGYNVALVMNAVSKVFADRLKARNKIVLFVFLLVYTVICGCQPPVIRAAIMGYVSYLALAEGRALNGLILLVDVCLLMLVVFPEFIKSLSFWLSVGSTLGLMFFGHFIGSRMERYCANLPRWVTNILPLEDLSNSLACQLMVWPLISYFFGRVSVVSPIYNMAVLWLVPMCTILGFAFLLTLYLLPFTNSLMVALIMPFYDSFYRVISFFAFLDQGSVQIKITLTFFILYYIALSGAVVIARRLNQQLKVVTIS